MKSSELIRWGAIAALLAGVSFVLLSLSSLAISGPASILDAGQIVATLLVLASVAGLHAAQEEGYGLLGRAGSLILVVGLVGNLLGLLAVVAGSRNLGWLSFPVGVLVMFVGFVVLGIATWRARVLPRWCGAALILAMPLTFGSGVFLRPEGDGFGDYPGAIMLGVVWLALDYALRSQVARRPASAGREPGMERGVR